MMRADSQTLSKEGFPSDLQLDKVVGTGGCSTVYKGFQKSEQRVVAVKVVVWPDENDSVDEGAEPGQRKEAFIQNFHREACLTRRLNHPNIAGIFDSILLDDRGILVLEMVPFPLDDILEQCTTRLSLMDCAVVLRQVLAGIVYLHQNNYCHGDIKTENVLLCETGAKICDFGSTKHHDNIFGSDNVFTTLEGTLMYLAPEIMQGHEEGNLQYNAKVDTWAFGAVMLEVLTLERAWGDDESLFYERILSDVPSIPYGHVNDTTARQVLASCFAPAQLRPTCESLLDREFFAQAANVPFSETAWPSLLVKEEAPQTSN